MSSTTLNISFLNSEQLNNHSELDFFNEMKFKAKSGEKVYNYNTKTLFIGTEYESKNLSINDFAKVNYYELGLSVKDYLRDEIETIVINNNDLNTQKLLLGIRATEYKASSKLKENSEVRREIKFTTEVKNEILEFSDAVNLGQNFCKDLLNMRADQLHPESYPKILIDKFTPFGESVKITVLDKEMIDNLEMNWLSAVGRASKYGYNLVAIEIMPQGEIKDTKVFVGKGLTFDNGGVNIKEGGNSLGMHIDMGGSAIVFGTALSLAHLERSENTKFIFVCGMVENAINQDALHPGDILENIVGQTVNVYNTDAEGRLTLGDVAPWAIMTYKPSEITTLATLTGHAMMAFTFDVAPIFSNNSKLQSELYESFLNQQEEVVKGIIPKIAESKITDPSGLADLVNTSTYKSRQGGCQTAASFVMQTSQPKLWKKNRPDGLADYIPTAHIDVAGPVEDSKGLASGYGVSSLVDYCIRR
jgi:leucyl aminopeptidase